MQMSALILRQHFCCASFYFLSWFLFLQILTGFLFKFLLSVVANFLTLHGLPSSCYLPSLSFARSLRTFLSNQQMLPLSTDCSLPRLLLLLSLVFLVFSCFSCRLRRRAVRLIWKQICIIIFARFLWASEFFCRFCFFWQLFSFCRNWSWNCLVFAWLWLYLAVAYWHCHRFDY